MNPVSGNWKQFLVLKEFCFFLDIWFPIAIVVRVVAAVSVVDVSVAVVAVAGVVVVSVVDVDDVSIRPKLSTWAKMFLG